MTAPSNNVVDIITREVTERVLGEVESRVLGAIQAAQAEAQRRIDELLAPVDLEPAIEAPSPAKDAKSRALRTIVQGGIATVLVAIFTALATALNGGGVDLTSGEDWKVVAISAGTAAVTAVLSYVQRLVNPPKGQ
jgi:hypothetical protein